MFHLVESAPGVIRLDPVRDTPILAARVLAQTGFVMGKPVWAAVLDAQNPSVAITRRRVLAWDKLLVHQRGYALATWAVRDLSADLAAVQAPIDIQIGYAPTACGEYRMYAEQTHRFTPGDNVKAALVFTLHMAI